MENINGIKVRNDLLFDKYDWRELPYGDPLEVDPWLEVDENGYVVEGPNYGEIRFLARESIPGGVQKLLDSLEGWKSFCKIHGIAKKIYRDCTADDLLAECQKDESMAVGIILIDWPDSMEDGYVWPKYFFLRDEAGVLNVQPLEEAVVLDKDGSEFTLCGSMFNEVPTKDIKPVWGSTCFNLYYCGVGCYPDHITDLGEMYSYGYIGTEFVDTIASEEGSFEDIEPELLEEILLSCMAYVRDTFREREGFGHVSYTAANPLKPGGEFPLFFFGKFNYRTFFQLSPVGSICLSGNVKEV